MMFKTNMSMNKKTVASFVGMFILFGIGIGLSVYSYSRLVSDQKSVVKNDLKLKDIARQLSSNIREQIALEKEYVFSKDSKAIEMHDKIEKETKSLLLQIKNINVEYQSELQWKKIEEEYGELLTIFSKTVEVSEKEGDSKVGLRGRLRQYAHDVEKSIEKYNLDSSFKVSLLILRRHEKDFLLRRDEKYNKEAKKEAAFIKTELTRRNYKQYVMDEMSKAVDGYTKAFDELYANQVILNKNFETVKELGEDMRKSINSVVNIIDSRIETDRIKIERYESMILKGLPVLFLIIAVFAFAFQYNFTKSINNIVLLSEKLRDSARVTEQSSTNMSMASTKVSSSVTQQASAIQETVATLNEITAMVNKSVENAKVSSEKAGESQRVALDGKKAVNDMVDAIGQINGNNEDIMKEMTRSNEEIVKIVDVINEISQKTNVINDIVFQTKLLSFNASVEAARAGEHGKGFAVVAEEVGNLAQMSGNAAREIEELLSGSIRKVQSIVDETQSSVSGLISNAKTSIEKGVTVSENCGKILDSVVTNVESVTAMMHEISNASQEQAEGINNITDAMNELDEVTHTNTTIAQETSGFAESLSEQTSVLNRIVEELEGVVLGKSNDVAVSKESLLDSIGAVDVDDNEDDFPSFDSSASIEEEEYVAPVEIEEVVAVAPRVEPVKDVILEVSPDEYPSEDDERFDKAV